MFRRLDPPPLLRQTLVLDAWGGGGGAKKGPFTRHPLRRLVEGPKKAPPLDSLEGVGLSEPTKKALNSAP